MKIGDLVEFTYGRVAPAGQIEGKRSTQAMESKARSLIKTILWRIIATANSFIILAAAMTDSPLKNALVMNASGFIIYFMYERLCNKVTWGRKK